jgi:hypothetical protein
MKLDAAARAAGVPETDIEQLGFAFEAALTPLIDAGRKMKQQGSQINVRRTVKGHNYDVDIVFGNVKPRGLFARLSALFKSD